jgi:spore coat protein U-like protein
MKKILLASLILASTGALAGGTSSLPVTANVVGTCKITANSGLAFGNLDPSAAADKTVNGNVSYWCTKGVTGATITADNGANAAAGAKRMKGPGATDFLAYSMSAVAMSATAPAGPSVPLTGTFSGTVLGADFAVAAAGAYNDTITLTINP